MRIFAHPNPVSDIVKVTADYAKYILFFTICFFIIQFFFFFRFCFFIIQLQYDLPPILKGYKKQHVTSDVSFFLNDFILFYFTLAKNKRRVIVIF